MLLNHILLSAFLLLSEIESSTAKAITFRANTILRRGNDLNEVFERTATEALRGDLVAREALPQQSSDSITAPITSSDTTGNVTAACMKAVSTMDNAINPAGIVACYALPYVNTTNGIFAAELHLYSVATPSGAFAGIPQKDILFSIAYPAATISMLTRKMRREVEIQRREAAPSNTPSEVLASTFDGAFNEGMQLDKLNSTELMSLLIPTITLEARSKTEQLVTTNLTASDIAFFPTGTFSTQPQSAIDASDSSTLATFAETAAAGFILPGRTLGIFPTGLIVTGSWTVLFLGAFGLGTLGRIQHRRQFRQRIANPRRRGRQ